MHCWNYRPGLLLTEVYEVVKVRPIPFIGHHWMVEEQIFQLGIFLRWSDAHFQSYTHQRNKSLVSYVFCKPCRSLRTYKLVQCWSKDWSKVGKATQSSSRRALYVEHTSITHCCFIQINVYSRQDIWTGQLSDRPARTERNSKSLCGESPDLPW